LSVTCSCQVVRGMLLLLVIIVPHLLSSRPLPYANPRTRQVAPAATAVAAAATAATAAAAAAAAVIIATSSLICRLSSRHPPPALSPM
jgi:hypothetical protein